MNFKASKLSMSSLATLNTADPNMTFTGIIYLHISYDPKTSNVDILVDRCEDLAVTNTKKAAADL